MNKLGKLIAVGVILLIGALAIFLVIGKTIRIDPPQLTSSNLQLQPYETRLAVKVSMPQSEVEAQIRTAVAPNYSGTERLDIGGNIHEERVEYSINPGSASVAFADQTARINAPFSGSARFRARYCPLGCGIGGSSLSETINVNGTAKIFVNELKVNPDYSIASKIDLDLDLDRAVVYLFGRGIRVSLRGELKDAFNRKKPSIISTIQGKVAELDIGGKVQQAWDDTDHIIELSESPKTWAVLIPKSVHIAPIEFTDGAASLAVDIVIDAQLHVGDRPTQEKTPLPPVSDVIEERGFSVKIPVYVDLETIASYANTNYPEVVVGEDGPQTLTLSNFELAEGDDRVLVSAAFKTSGLFKDKGRIYLWTQPILSADGKTLVFHDVRLTSETSSALTENGLSTLAPLIVSQVANQLKIDLSEHYDKAKVEIADSVAAFPEKYGITPKLNLETLKLSDLQLGDGMIATVFNVEGELSVNVSSE